jgi:hypothetical protein
MTKETYCMTKETYYMTKETYCTRNLAVPLVETKGFKERMYPPPRVCILLLIRRDLAAPLVETKGLVKLLLDVAEETQSKGGLWRLALRVVGLFCSLVGLFVGLF